MRDKHNGGKISRNMSQTINLRHETFYFQKETNSINQLHNGVSMTMYVITNHHRHLRSFGHNNISKLGCSGKFQKYFPSSPDTNPSISACKTRVYDILTPSSERELA